LKTTEKYGKEIDMALGVWVKLARAASTMGKLSSENIRAFGLTEPQFAALECLGHLGTLKLSVLSKKMLVSGGNLTIIIDNLEKERLVERIPSKEDRRAILVQLTSKGQKLFKDIFLKHAEFIANIASVLTEKEQQALANLLKKLGITLRDRYLN